MVNTSRVVIRHGRGAFEKDSTFYLAALWEMYWQAEQKAPRTDTLIAFSPGSFYQ